VFLFACFALFSFSLNVACVQVVLFLELCFYALFMTLPVIYMAFGITDSQPTVIGLAITYYYILMPFHIVSTLCAVVV